MRIINKDFETITEYDLSIGYLSDAIAIKEDAEPIDNVNKFAWANEDYEQVKMYLPNPVIEEVPPSDTERIDALELALNLLLGGNTEVSV